MKYLLSEEELQEMKDEITGAKELHDSLQKQARSQGVRIRAIESLCEKIVNGCVAPWTDTEAAKSNVAEEVLDIINSRLERLLVMLNLPREEGD